MLHAISTKLGGARDAVVDKMMHGEHAEARKQTVNNFFSALNNKDTPALLSLFSPNASVAGAQLDASKAPLSAAEFGACGACERGRGSAGAQAGRPGVRAGKY